MCVHFMENLKNTEMLKDKTHIPLPHRSKNIYWYV